MPAVVLTFASCSSGPAPKSFELSTDKPNVQANTVVTAQKGVVGGTVIETYEGTGTVTAINAAKRTVTLVRPDGEKATFNAGPEVRNFAQIQVGDKVKAKLIDELVVFLRKKGAPPTNGESAAVLLAPLGAKPGVVKAETVEVTATVDSVNLARRQATLRFPDGHTQIFKVRPDVDMTQATIGEEVVIRTTQAQALTLEKP
jgi:translation elongation factor P/translation initiation factor 5A